MAFVYWIHLPEHKDITTEGYIGFTSKTVEVRFRDHLSTANDRSRQHYPVYRAILKYKDSVVVSTLVEGSPEYCLDIERRLRPSESIGWNITVGGSRGSLGLKSSEETKAKLKLRSGENGGFYGKRHSEESKAKMAERKRGKVASQETREKLSKAMKGVPLNLSEEQRRKRRERVRNFRHSSESKLKMAEAQLGKYDGWKNPSAGKSWLLAVDMFNFMLTHQECTKGSLAKQFSISYNSVVKVFEKLKSGWNPNEDQEYLSWLEEKKG
jgi:group I intron endonuclease